MFKMTVCKYAFACVLLVANLCRIWLQLLFILTPLEVLKYSGILPLIHKARHKCSKNEYTGHCNVPPNHKLFNSVTTHLSPVVWEIASIFYKPKNAFADS